MNWAGFPRQLSQRRRTPRQREDRLPQLRLDTLLTQSWRSPHLHRRLFRHAASLPSPPLRRSRDACCSSALFEESEEGDSPCCRRHWALGNQLTLHTLP